jgi:hypothetical protein
MVSGVRFRVSGALLLSLKPEARRISNRTRLYKPIKSQISSTKLQINSKLQYSMTKIFTIVSFHRFATFDLLVMMPQGTSSD